MTENNKAKKYKVIIPTAGTGSRLNELTKYINKSLVSIENKPVISRIIEMFPEDTDFVIALGYKGDLVKESLTLTYPNKNFKFVNIENYEGIGSGLGLTLLKCEKYLQEPFVFCSCDTLVKENIPFPDKNIVGYDYRKNCNQYRTLKIEGEKVTDIYEKNHNNNETNAYIGLCCIYDWKIFWEKMHEKQDEAINTGEALPLKYFKDIGTLYSKKFTWFDTGNKIELEKTKEYFKEENQYNILPKPDEAIWFVEDKVIKFSDNKNFISDRVKRADILKGFVPEITSSGDNIYIYKKINGIVLSKIQTVDLFKKLLNFSKTFWKEEILNDTEKIKFINTCFDFYQEKTKKRVQLFYERFNQEDNKDIVNGKELPKLSEMLNSLDWNYLCNGLSGRFHGDFHFENILYDKNKNTFSFLDWRQNFGGSLTIGDIYCDLAKLLHGLIICHELIAQNKFKISINKNIINYSFERKDILKECEEYYYQWLNDNNYDTKKVKILTALIYLNIAALHHYPYCNLLYWLGKNMLYENMN